MLPEFCQGTELVQSVLRGTGKAGEKQVLTQEAGGRLSGKSGDLLLFCEVGWKNFGEEFQDLTFTTCSGPQFFHL